jgi:hypothetical protein
MGCVARVLAAVVAPAAGMGNAEQRPAKLALLIGVTAQERDTAEQRAGGFIVSLPLANALRDSGAPRSGAGGSWRARRSPNSQGNLSRKTP